jgi:hypothetical protein
MCADDSQRVALRRDASRAYATITELIVFESMTMRLTIRFALVAGFVSMAGLSTGCDSSRTTAQEILRRTIPPGDATPTLSAPVRSERSLQFTWDFDTHLTPAEYTAWLKRHIQDFAVVDDSRLGLSLAKHIGGDVYRLRMKTESGTGTTRVHAQLTASAD